ncbi:hypothetical protein PHISCL_06483 [Aspergillus sclerotialis]|uniref:Small ribosomal subunit protein mS38 n=1 Tax=Aspergillus sclerotialis TaxID=2070753 RepID=A0A3A2ZDF7_9EURO|nr:hypothetical protein PHISCL_06483 [Aspergillus sclerotialis]
MRRVAWAPTVPIPGISRSSGQTLAASSNIRQRRYSSSSSKPSDGSRKVDTSSQTPAKASRRRGRDGNGRNGSSKPNQNPAFSNLPSVPSTQHRQPHDIHVASFFSLHRPISVTTTVPPPSSSETFDAIFSSKKPPKSAQQDVIYTLSSAIDSMETAAQQHGAEEEGPVYHFDGEGSQFDAMNMSDLKVSVENMARQFRPFQPPPAPVPFDESKDVSEVEQVSPRSTEGSSYSTVLTIRESTSPDGRTTFNLHTSPFIRTSDMEAPGAIETDMADPRPGSTYIERLRHNRMQAMSTRRRRRIKMKKHKWKKRLRATRSIRQKLDKT